MISRLRLLVVLSLCGLLLNLLLLYGKLANPSSEIMGCGGGGPCSDVLTSRWSQVLQIPVPALGAFVYLFLLTSLRWNKHFIAGFCHAAIVGSVVWFIIVQAVLLHHFCPWCIVAHAVGCFVAALGISNNNRENAFCKGLIAGAVGAVSLILVQVYGPVPAAHWIDQEMNLTASRAAGIHAFGTGRKIAFDDGRKIYNCASLPHLGSVDAKWVLVEYFDYQCGACHTMRAYLSALVRKHPTEICIVLLPVPLDHQCNPALELDDDGHPGSCELTKIALAVWRVKPEAYLALHEALMSDPPPDRAAALTLAQEHISPARLDAAMLDPWIDRIIQADIADWVSFSGKTKVLPKLLVSGKRILHGLPSDEEDFIRVMEHELGL